MLARHPHAATHRYRDLPLVMTPIFWNKAFGRIYGKDIAPIERAHKDRIMVTPDSPEALEEILWMAFFARCHDVHESQVLDRTTRAPSFEAFYRDHLRKILLIRGGRRYISKGNYNITRLAYLQHLFPQARFIVPIRDPRWHVASLLKQHRLFCENETRDPRILRYMQRIGHFEFGLDRRSINTGDRDGAKSIDSLWSSGQEVRGWARLWASVYSALHRQLANDPVLQQATLVVRYEDLCQTPGEMVARVFAHAEMVLTPERQASLAREISEPAYYSPRFTDEEEQALREETAETAAHFGYAN